MKRRSEGGLEEPRAQKIRNHDFLPLPNIEEVVYEIDQATKIGDLQTVQLLCQNKGLDFSKSKALGACYRFGYLEIMVFLLGDERVLVSLKKKPNVAINVCLELIKNNYFELADRVAIYCNTTDLMTGLMANVNAHIYIPALAKTFIGKALHNMLHHFLSDARTTKMIASDASLVYQISVLDLALKKECISKIMQPYFFKRYSAVDIGMKTKESNLSLFNQDIFFTILNCLYLLHAEDINGSFVIPYAETEEKSKGVNPSF